MPIHNVIYLYFQRTVPNSGGFSKGNPGPSANDTMAVQKEVSLRDIYQPPV